MSGNRYLLNLRGAFDNFQHLCIAQVSLNRILAAASAGAVKRVNLPERLSSVRGMRLALPFPLDEIGDGVGAAKIINIQVFVLNCYAKLVFDKHH